MRKNSLAPNWSDLPRGCVPVCASADVWIAGCRRQFCYIPCYCHRLEETFIWARPAFLKQLHVVVMCVVKFLPHWYLLSFSPGFLWEATPCLISDHVVEMEHMTHILTTKAMNFLSCVDSFRGGLIYWACPNIKIPSLLGTLIGLEIWA